MSKFLRFAAVFGALPTFLHNPFVIAAAVLVVALIILVVANKVGVNKPQVGVLPRNRADGMPVQRNSNKLDGAHPLHSSNKLDGALPPPLSRPPVGIALFNHNHRLSRMDGMPPLNNRSPVGGALPLSHNRSNQPPGGVLPLSRNHRADGVASSL